MIIFIQSEAGEVGLMEERKAAEDSDGQRSALEKVWFVLLEGILGTENVIEEA